MSYLNNLAKGFVRSAVNQVGRDGGKVISNQVYGNAHSTPLRTNLNHTTIESTDLIEEKEYIYVKFFWAIILSGLIPILGGLIVLYRGYVNFNKKFIKMYKIENQAVYSQDKRFKTGNRYEGTKQIKIPVNIETNEEQKKRAKIKSYGYLIIGMTSIIMYILALK
jgi:hypothetical protein